MSKTPRTHVDPEGDKRRALRLLAHATQKLRDAEAAQRAAMKFARDAGASLREMAEVTGLNHNTVRTRIGEPKQTK